MRVLMGILRWVMGLLAVLLLLSTFKDAKPVHALGFLVLSALLLPPAYRRVDAWFLQRLPVALRKPAIFMAIGVAIACLVWGGGSKRPTAAPDNPTRTADESRVAEQILRLEEAFHRFDIAPEAEREKALAAIQELAAFDDADAYLRCQKDPACFDSLLGAIVFLEVEGDHAWSENVLDAEAFAIDLVSGRRESVPFRISVRNGRTLPASEDAKGMEYTVHQQTKTLNRAQTGATRFRVAGVVQESRLGGGVWQALNGFVLDGVVDPIAMQQASSVDLSETDLGTTTATAPVEADLQLPQDQVAFLSAIDQYREQAKSIENPIRLDGIAEAFCRSYRQREFQGWIARLEEIRAPGLMDDEGQVGVGLKIGSLHYGSEGGSSQGAREVTIDDDGGPGGAGYHAVHLGSFVHDWKREAVHQSRILPGTKVYQQLAELEPGEFVRISGRFIDGSAIRTDIDGGLVDYDFCLALNAGITIGKVPASRFFGGDDQASFAIKLSAIERWQPASR